MTKRYQKPPFEVSARIFSLSAEVMRLVGRYEGLSSPKPQPKLRRSNQIRTIVGSLALEGNTLSVDQATALLDRKRVIGPKKDIIEVENALAVYAIASRLNPARVADLLRAHRTLMRGLIADAGSFRTGNVGIYRGTRVSHVAPPAKQLARLVTDLLAFVKSDPTSPLIKSAVAHYELEFIHPFSDGNGRIGRLWQHVLLVRLHPVFEYVPFESVIHTRQREYYGVLRDCDRAGESTAFIEFSLAAIAESLESFLGEIRPSRTDAAGRLDLARKAFGRKTFSRKDYLSIFTTLSTASASRDLKRGTDERILLRSGDKAKARYRFRS